jgi:peptidoglycan/LPS O-acetylase OafA/YrhL
MNINSKPNHIFVLDDLGGIAIITVAFYHYFFVYFKSIDTKNRWLGVAL